MGPPRSDAGVAIGILMGFMVSWKSQRFKKLIFRKYQDSTRTFENPKLWINGRYFLRHVFDSLGFAYAFDLFMHFQDLLRLHRRAWEFLI